MRCRASLPEVQEVRRHYHAVENRHTEKGDEADACRGTERHIVNIERRDAAVAAVAASGMLMKMSIAGLTAFKAV